MAIAQQPRELQSDRLSYNTHSSGKDGSIIPTQQTYRERLYPWCIIRHLPNMQRLTVARFRRRNEAEEHLQVLRRLIPNAELAIIFDSGIINTDVLYSAPLHNQG